MSWPAHIVSKSSRLTDTDPIGNGFYGLYNAIIVECLPPSQFMITPQYATAGAPEITTIGTIDFAITFVIEPLDLESPVLFMEVKAPTHLAPIPTRKYAENQAPVRARFGLLAHLV